MVENTIDKAKTEKTETRLAEIVDIPSVSKYIFDHYRSIDKEYYARMAISRWKEGTRYPSIEMLVEMAKICEKNLSYILGLTDIDCACDFKEPRTERTLEELLDTCEMSNAEFAAALNRNYRSINMYKKALPINRLSSLIKIAKILDLSLDYILGYTDWKNWEFYLRSQDPFRDIRSGSGVYIVADKSVRTRADIENAIMRGDGQYGLTTTDGKSVLFPNGSSYSIDDEMFIGAYVTTTVPEVK